MAKALEEKQKVVIKFAGDSGDGMQLTGNQFTDNTAYIGNDLATFPDYPAEIRAPQGTLAGVSGYQIHFGSDEVSTPGDRYDVLVAMNAAALRANLGNLKEGGIIICNSTGFDAKNLRLSGHESNPLEDGSLEGFELFSIDITKLTRECLKDIPLGTKEKDRSKNMFVLGLLYWLFNRNPDSTIEYLKEKFAKKPDILEANIKALKAGYHFGDTTEIFSARYEVGPARLEAGSYRNIMGNEATVLGLVAASQKAGIDLFLGSYPITPASDILHGLSRYKNFGVRTFQAEDEIAAISSAIGAAFGGHLGATSTSGPGMALKTEAMGLAVMLELPLLVIDVQRAGPSTGMPTKTEQADLLQAMYGRNGEAPLPVLAASTPADAFDTVYEACRIAIEHMTPVVFLSDGYIANGSEPWRYPSADDLPPIRVRFARPSENGTPYFPYARDEKLVRTWAIPGTKGLEHRLGGLEKEDITGNVSYDPDNHEKMVKIRAEKVARIAEFIPPQKIDAGPDSGRLLVIGWGSTYGAIRAAMRLLQRQGIHDVAHVHLRYINPFPANLEEIISRFDSVAVPEINNGQLVKIIRDRYCIDARPVNKIKGVPFRTEELASAFRELLNAKNETS